MSFDLKLFFGNLHNVLDDAKTDAYVKVDILRKLIEEEQQNAEECGAIEES